MCFKKKKRKNKKEKRKKLKVNVISLEILTVLLFSRCQYLLVSCSPYFVFFPLFWASFLFLFFYLFFFYHTSANLQFQFQSSMITIRLRKILYSLNSYKIWNTNDWSNTQLFPILGSWKLTFAMDKEQLDIEHKAIANVRNWYWLYNFQVVTHRSLNGDIKNIEKPKSRRRLRDWGSILGRGK